MTINSGILYLEKFIEDSNLLPSDLGRLLNFIKALDERLQGAPRFSHKGPAAQIVPTNAILKSVCFSVPCFATSWKPTWAISHLCRSSTHVKNACDSDKY